MSLAGAEIVLVPNCCPLATDPHVGDVRIAGTRTRAFESVVGMAVANYPAPKADGHSFAVNAQGSIVAEAEETPCLLMVEFDLAEIRKTRKQEWFRWQL